MFKKKKNPEKTHTPSPEEANSEIPAKRKKHVPLLKRVGLLLLVSGIFGGGGFFGWTCWQDRKPAYPGIPLSHVEVEEPLLEFCWQKMPGVHDALFELDAALGRIEGELVRLHTIETSFPAQKRQTQTEIRAYDRLKKTLLKGSKKTASSIESLYVAWKIREEAGSRRVDGEKDRIKASIRTPLKRATPALSAIPDAPPPSGLLGKLKATLPPLPWRK